MGRTERRCVHVSLSIFILLLGVVCTLLLYFAGKNAVDLFWGADAMYIDSKGRINHRDVTDEWYGRLVLRGWAFGLVYVVPGLSGFVAALFYNKYTMVVHSVIASLVLFVGSFLHTTGAVALVMYRYLVVGGFARQDPFLGDCIYGRESSIVPYEDPKCLVGRRAMNFSIGAVCMLCVSWVAVLLHVLYTGFTFSSVTKTKKSLDITSGHASSGNSPDSRAAVASCSYASRGKPRRARWRGGRPQNEVASPRPQKEVASPIAPELPTSGEAAGSDEQEVLASAEDQPTAEIAREALADVTNEAVQQHIPVTVTGEDVKMDAVDVGEKVIITENKTDSL